MSHATTLSSLHRAPARGASLSERLRAFVRPLQRSRRDRLAAARDAAAVRRLAYQVQADEPALASDLLAAADRHERQFDSAR